jgi:hypothetical protein
MACHKLSCVRASTRLDCAALVLGHTGDTGILAALSLQTIVWIIDLLRHVTSLRNSSRHSAMVGRHRGHIFRRLWNIAALDTVLVASWFLSVEAGLSRDDQ